MTRDELNNILDAHKFWLFGIDGRKADLRGADLRGADLMRANLRDANIIGADLREANLMGADLRDADLRGADLRGADLRRANLRVANLSGSDLMDSDLMGADLSNADLSGADINYPISCPEKGSFIGFKKCRDSLIVELKITDDSLRCSATGRKCRCSKAKVISITNLNGAPADVNVAHSIKNYDFIYKVGEIVEAKDFDTNRWNECSTGIHFFIDRNSAVNYNRC